MDISSRERRLRLGVQLWPQQASWPEAVAAATDVDRIGWDSLWTWDHFYPHVGAFSGPNFEAWTFLAALAALTRRVQLGVLVSAVTYRSPALLAYQAATLDHISGGRAALGLGAGWFAYEHERLGFTLGSVRERLDRLEEAAGILRDLLRGQPVTSPGRFFHLPDATLDLRPLQRELPLVLGGGGEARALQIVARYADVWNYYGPAEVVAHKNAVLDAHCARVGRDPREIRRAVCLPVIVRSDRRGVERRLEAVCQRNRVAVSALVGEAGEPIAGPPELVAERVNAYLLAGFEEVVLMGPAPYDHETFERFWSEVRPMLTAPAARPVPASTG